MIQIIFIARTLDQLDFALDHVALADPNYKRLALMLVDNAMELALHAYAQQKQIEHKYDHDLPETYRRALEDALGQRFELKVKFAKITGFLSETVGHSVATLHSYRNNLYHRGLMHEEILHSLAMFYLHVACHVMAAMPDTGYSWSGREKLPIRAIKYLGPAPIKNPHEVIPAAWKRLRDVASAIPYNLAAELHAQQAAVIAETDEFLDYLTDQGSARMARDQVVIDVQVWEVMFSKEGKEFRAKDRSRAKSSDDIADWFRKNYPFKVLRDPIPAWKRQLSSLKVEKDEHTALKRYQDFMQRNEKFRTALSMSVAAFDEEINRRIDAARESRRP